MIAPGAAVVPETRASQAVRPWPPDSPRVLAERLTKRFDRHVVLRGVDLRLEQGERVALFGPNGAGKTTLLRILATLAQPTAGRVVIDGIPVREQPAEARRRLGVVAHQPYLYPDLTAAENLHFFARMYDVPGAGARVAELLEVVGLSGRASDRVGTFSRGMLQRLALARAILHRPAVLLLDEPDTGLDREGLRVLEALLVGQTEGGGTVLLTTHDLRFGLANAERALVLRGGRLVLDIPAGEIAEAGLDALLASGN